MVYNNIYYILLCMIFNLYFIHNVISAPRPMVDCWFGACRNSDCALMILNHMKIYHPETTILLYPTVNFNLDGYFGLYFGRLVDIFDKVPNKVYYLLVELPLERYLTDIRIIFKHLPLRSIIVSLEHGYGIGIRILEQIKIVDNTGPSVVIHMNHEQPWQFFDKNSLDYIYEDIESLADSYSLHPLVLRNYYYEPLQFSSHFFPVGTSTYGFVIGNTSSVLYKTPFSLLNNNINDNINNNEFERLNTPLLNLKSSLRKNFCFFTGRIEYAETVLHSQKNERIFLTELHNNNKINKCKFVHPQKPQRELLLLNVLDKDEKDIKMHTYEYEEFLLELVDSAFALCPAGNNPETFRLYEAFELGTIPLFVRPNSEISFMNYGNWNKYPGPIFSSWNELEPFIENISFKEMDEMQKLVVSWYSEFQDFVKYDLSDQIMNTFKKLEKKNNQNDEYNNAINKLKQQIKILRSKNDIESFKELNELLNLMIDIENLQEL